MWAWAISNLIALFIIVTLGGDAACAGVTDMQTSTQAAEALRPLAGVFTFALFAFGIIGIGLLSIPVLAGSCAYALGEALGWTDRPRPKTARRQGLLRHHHDVDTDRRRS